jgi:uncharacterized membrane protein YhaH (DUF805 family)
MSDPHDQIGVAKPTGWFWWLCGRAGRREYWASVGCVFAVGLTMEYFPGGPRLESALDVVLIFLQIRRVHDFDRSGWWVVAASFATLPAGFALATFTSLVVAIIGSIALAAALTILIGVVPGTSGDNRFGPRPQFTAKRVLTGR